MSLPDAFCGAGLLLAVAALAWIWLPLALLAGGAFLVAGGVHLHRRTKEAEAARRRGPQRRPIGDMQ